MNKKKEQKVVVFTTLSETDKNLILNGVKLAVTFKKELCLFYRITRKDKKRKSLIKQILVEYTLPLSDEIPGLKTSVLLMSEHIRDIPAILADEYEAVLFVADAAQYKKFSTAVTQSPSPFLFVNNEAPLSSFKKIVLPLDARRENKDIALWSSWFGRFNQSEIIVIAANDNNRERQIQVGKNVLLTKKLLEKFNIPLKIYKGQKSSFYNSAEAAEFAHNDAADLLILLGSSVITPIDRLLGLPERKIISFPGSFPVLLINPRRENYILCD